MLVTGFPPLPCQEECDVFFVTLVSTWGCFHVRWYFNGPWFFSLVCECIASAFCILHLSDNAFCSLLLLTLVLPSSKLWVPLIYHWWVFASLVWFQAPSYQLSPVFPLWRPCCYPYIIALAALCVSPKYIFLCRITSCHHCVYKNIVIKISKNTQNGE